MIVVVSRKSVSWGMTSGLAVIVVVLAVVVVAGTVIV